MELFIFLLFCSALLLCIFFRIPVVYAIIFGLILAFLYGKRKGFSLKQLIHISLSGVKTTKNIIITFLMIGVLTALWRASGTISIIISSSIGLIHPGNFILISFLLNCCVSVLTGTAFGTAATMGSICMTIAYAMNIDPFWVGGSILAGAYFGDRCSPVSTSALLVGALTKTDLFQNIRKMIHSAIVPFLISCGIYLLVGMNANGTENTLDVRALFQQEFTLHWICFLPAIMILLLSFFKINVKCTILVSIITAFLAGIYVQNLGPLELCRCMFFGFRAKHENLAVMIDGGGVISMVQVTAIVLFSSCYMGILQETGLLNQMKEKIIKLSQKITPYGATLLTSVLAGAISCNQTLTIMLAHQLCKDTEPNQQKFAIFLEDSSVIIVPLIPWSVAASVTLGLANAPIYCVLTACFLYLLPMWRMLTCICKLQR